MAQTSILLMCVILQRNVFLGTLRRHMALLSRLLLAAALVLFFLTSWIILPAPNRPPLMLGVGVPEVSAWRCWPDSSSAA